MANAALTLNASGVEYTFAGQGTVFNSITAFGVYAAGLFELSAQISLSDGSNLPSGYHSYTIADNGIVIQSGLLLQALRGEAKDLFRVNLGKFQQGSHTITLTLRTWMGVESSASETIVVQPYTPPAISSATVVRCVSDGTRSATGTYASVTATIQMPEYAVDTPVACTIKYRQIGTDAWATFAGVIYSDGRVQVGNTISAGNTVIVGDGTISTSARYEFCLTVNGYMNVQTAYECEMETESLMVISTTPNGDGVAIGMQAARPNALEVNPDWRLYVGGDRMLPVGKTLWEGSLGISGTATLDAAFSDYRLYGIVFSSGILCVCFFDPTTTSTALVSLNQVTTRHITLLITLELSNAGVLSMQSASSLRHEYSGSHGSVNATTTQTIAAVYGIA